MKYMLNFNINYIKCLLFKVSALLKSANGSNILSIYITLTRKHYKMN